MLLNFAKMHGLGNDYVVLDTTKKDINLNKKQIQLICDRRFGIGSDGILLVTSSREADVGMRMFNPDGSEAQMCGNGIRCLAMFAVDKGIVKKRNMTVNTKSGIKFLEIRNDGVTCNMGPPLKVRKDQYSLASGNKTVETAKVNGFAGTVVSVGNPHCVISVNDLDKFPVNEHGRQIETNKLFPQKLNVEFVEILRPGLVKQRTWERGAGETLACGTGACAVFWALYNKKQCANPLMIKLLGGRLRISVDKAGNILMHGEAKTVFEGKAEI